MYTEYNPDDGQTNCPKHVEFDAKNKFVKLVHPVGFIIKKFVTMNVKKVMKCFETRLAVLYVL